MKRHRLAALLGIFTCTLGLGAAAQPVGARLEAGAFVHRGMCEASAAVALPRGSFGRHFAVANDEDNVLRIYRADRSGRRTKRFDFDGLLHAPGGADVEGAAWLGDRIYWLASHSRNRHGERKDARQRLFATTPRGSASDPDVRQAVGTSAIDLLPSLLQLDQLPWLQAALGGPAPDVALNADGAGLNFEGLAAGPEGSLILALRGPLRDNGRIALLRLLNPDAAVTGAPVRWGEPAFLDLGGRGVRSIDRIDGRGGSYLIVAGPPTDVVPTSLEGPPFRLYVWSGRNQDDAVAARGTDAAMARLFDQGFTPEALIVDEAANRIQLLSDDGDRCGTATGDDQRFRSVILRLRW